MVSSFELEEALMSKSNNEKLGDYLINKNVITERQLIEVLEFQLGIPHVDLSRFKIDPELIQLIPAELAKSNLIIPLKKDRNKLSAAMADPMDYFAIEELRMATGCQIEPSIATKEQLSKYVSQYFEMQSSMDAALMDVTGKQSDADEDLTNIDSPMVRLVNQIISSALTQKASDIHFDPHEAEVAVRFRVDGVIRKERSLPKDMQNVVLARLKIMGNLNITETRVPQDGRIKTIINQKPVDIRLSSLPTVYGEKMVLRLHDLSNKLTALKNLDFSELNFNSFIKMIQNPNGIILITGPTGSGKSSTLYAALNELNEEAVNILTVEDPVEYQMHGINQIQVNEDVGLTFAKGLRSILRQDPDIVMIGEIRDQETAEIAIRASLTGHLVLSTLHTNSAAETITRLADMGIEPFLIASSLSGVVAQRLVRKVCRDCKAGYEPDQSELELLKAYSIEPVSLARGNGCPSCEHTGYKGRMAIHEVLSVDDGLKELIVNRAGTARIKQYMKEHSSFLHEDGLKKASLGQTTIKEILRVSSLS
ncbi:GspE/PulE family protein [Jeotgalibacillus haloalkalitolerans]|uniref:ATPase, T2SS/T4P/T4SS family n=1 Tax=Jeotgalibacillus haloalkalitolerans TaxID=3104292 RepID=A0ABU5KMA7_9BACL|nr:ATPase, T2SS/T4P/T4SS family [Jeotgalibacillus sp. HH7-29]MDZ5712369.1 ATPase, T2SS/T4P/T4SS family [Jeotgalibacillus sp. HH7-29]